MKRSRFTEEQIIGILRENEGGAKAEEFVFAGIDFEKHSPRYFMIENMSETRRSSRVRSILEGKGYRIVARVGVTDDLFARI
jgi:hypothetical protein